MNAPKQARPATKNLLVELGTEELPPKALKRLGERFGAAIADWLHEAGFIDAEVPNWRWFATPRRLAVWVESVVGQQGDQVNERRGPALSAAYDDSGKPTRAALGFAGSCGVDVDELETLETDKGEWLVHRSRVAGRVLGEVVEDCIARAVAGLPIPKRMRWGSGDAEFVRPVHWLVVLHGGDLLNAKVLGIESGQYSRGHRFHAPGTLRVTSADRYAELLKEKGCVWADHEERTLEIHLQVEKLAKKLGGRAVIDDALLEEVAGLVERPVAVAGNFDERYLEVPVECLVSSMRDHQKYFHVVDEDGALLPHFITVSNIASTEPRRVRQGNERVLNARLADADFFWREDRNRSLASRAEELQGLMFHNKLGSVAGKVKRMQALVRRAAREFGVDAEACVRAAALCKADLVTAMVGEFPELQGVMGRYYALHDGESEVVAQAIEEHYRPRHAGDEIPGDAVSRLVAVADKIDTLTGIFAAGEAPTGDKDPYALRRIALGLIRIVVEGKLDLDIASLVDQCAALYEAEGVKVEAQARRQAVEFVVDRYPAHYAAGGFSADEIAAVAAVRPSRPLDVDQRLRAVSVFRGLAAADSLAAANKRIGNILKKSDRQTGAVMDFDRFVEPAERALAEQLVRVTSQVSPLVKRGDYDEALKILAGFRDPVDRFFDEVMVMDPDEDLRKNRLALLGQLSGLFMGIADLSRLQPRENGA
jgi:glycyl-tRNA synthetase beta chain